MKRTLLLIAGSMAGTGGAALAQSESTASGTLEEVVVTAQHREQRAADVGIAMSVLSGEELQRKGLTSSTQLADLSPGVHMSGGLAGQSQQFSIRGVTQNDFSDSIEAPVAVYIDDGYVPTQQGQTLAMFDIARAEILKGPQGTLFGRNATGGLVHFVVNTPSREPSATADVSFGRLNETKVEASVTGPLAEKVSGRVSVFYNRMENFWSNEFPTGSTPGLPTSFGPPLSICCQDEGGFRTYAGRGQLQFDISDALSIRLVGSGAKRRLSTAPYTSVATTPVVNADGAIVDVIRTDPSDTRTIIGPDGNNYFNPALFPLQGAAAGLGFGPAPGLRFPGSTWFGYSALDPEDMRLSVQFARDDANTDASYNAAMHVQYEGESLSFASISNYMRFTKQLMMDASGTPQNLFQYGTNSRTSSFSQEFRLSNSREDLRWLTGLYFLHIDSHARDGLLGSTGSLFAGLFGMSATGVDPIGDRTLKTDSSSLFGQLEYEFAPRWTVVFGARAILEKQDYDLRYYAAANANDYAVDTATELFPLSYPPFADSRTQDLYAGKLQIEYRPVDGLLWYLGVNRGVKAGSYNAKAFDGSPPIAPSDIPYQPEVLISTEGGVKWTPAGLPLTLDASVFHYDYRDYQAFLFTTNTGVVFNVDARTNGAEAQLTTRFRDLRLSLGWAYTDAVIPNFTIAPGVFRDVTPSFTPKNTGAFQALYSPSARVFGGRVEMGVDVSYSSSFYHNLRNFTADELAGRTLANASLSWFSGDDERWHTTLYGRNLSDKRYANVGFDSAANCGCSIESYGLPRTYGVAVGAKF